MTTPIFQPTDDMPSQMEASEAFPFVQDLGLIILEADNGRAALALDLDFRHTNSVGAAHGGVVMAMLDVVMGQAAISAVPDARGAITIAMQTSFVQPAGPAGTRLRAVGTVLHRGRSTVFCEAEILNADGRLAAKASGTFKVRRARAAE